MKTFEEYQLEAKRTAKRQLEAYPEPIRVAAHGFAVGSQDPEVGAQAAALHAELLRVTDVLVFSLGLAGEAGEVADLMKKVHGHGKPYDRETLKKELGDVLWYLANLATAHGLTLSEIAQGNSDKLRARYPNGFTVAASNARADEQASQADPNQVGVEKVVFRNSAGYPVSEVP